MKYLNILFVLFLVSCESPSNETVHFDVRAPGFYEHLINKNISLGDFKKEIEWAVKNSSNLKIEEKDYLKKRIKENLPIDVTITDPKEKRVNFSINASITSYSKIDNYISKLSIEDIAKLNENE